MQIGFLDAEQIYRIFLLVFLIQLIFPHILPLPYTVDYLKALLKKRWLSPPFMYQHKYVLQVTTWQNSLEYKMKTLWGIIHA